MKNGKEFWRETASASNKTDEMMKKNAKSHLHQSK